MPYISTEVVKEKRNAIKKAFPKWKFSIVREHYSGINVSILESPYKIEKDYKQINPYHYENHYKDNPKLVADLKKIVDILNGGNGELVYDADYGSVPKFYVSLEFGKWDKAYKQITK